jgi:putative transposase
MEHSHLKRLDRIWIENPIFFITACTDKRRNILANSQTATILVEEWTTAKERHDWYIGRYVIMPNHVHFFCAPGIDAPDLSVFMKFWKEWTSKKK